VNTSEMITHVFPLERVQEAFDLRNNKDSACSAIHVLIDCEATGGEAKAVVEIPFAQPPVHALSSAGPLKVGWAEGGGSSCGSSACGHSSHAE
jgi:hypothetical protein